MAVPESFHLNVNSTNQFLTVPDNELANDEDLIQPLEPNRNLISLIPRAYG